MWDDKSIAELAARVAMRILAILQKAGYGVANSGNWIYPRVFTVRQAASYLGRTEKAVQHLIFKHELPVVRADRRVHVLREDLDAWLLRHRRS